MLRAIEGHVDRITSVDQMAEAMREIDADEYEIGLALGSLVEMRNEGDTNDPFENAMYLGHLMEGFVLGARAARIAGLDEQQQGGTQ